MKEVDFARIETELDITLPAAYRRTMATEGPILASLAADAKRAFTDDGTTFFTANAVIEDNLAERPNDAATGYAFPNWSLSFMLVGTNGAGDYYCLRLDNKPGVWMIGSDCGDKPSRAGKSFKEHVAMDIQDRRASMTNADLVVSYPVLTRDAWLALQRDVPSFRGLYRTYEKYSQSVDACRYKLRSKGKEPQGVVIDRGELQTWCTKNARSLDKASLKECANEKLLNEQPWITKQRTKR